MRRSTRSPSASPTPRHVSVDCSTSGCPARVELAAYFVASEALANVGKYAQALARRDPRVAARTLAVIEIADDGIGGADAGRGSGLRGLADRVEALGGRLRVVSPAGGGTALTAEMPCNLPDGEIRPRYVGPLDRFDLCTFRCHGCGSRPTSPTRWSPHFASARTWSTVPTASSTSRSGAGSRPGGGADGVALA